MAMGLCESNSYYVAARGLWTASPKLLSKWKEGILDPRVPVTHRGLSHDSSCWINKSHCCIRWRCQGEIAEHDTVAMMRFRRRGF
jgi:hypothetical protein